MNIYDRFAEFQQIVTFLKPLLPNAEVERKSDNLVPHNFFKQTAKVNRNCFHASLKLKQLEHLTRNEYILDDKNCEINRLLVQVKDILGYAENDINILDEILSETVFSSDQYETFCKNIKCTLRDKVSSLTKDLKRNLENYTQLIKKRHVHLRNFSIDSSDGDFPPEICGKSLLLQNEDGVHSNSLLANSDCNLNVENKICDLKNIESTIVELGYMFNTLSVVIQEQGETLNKIDSYVEKSTMDVDSAHSHLLQYFQTLSRNRNFVLKIFALLTFVFVTSIVLFA